MRDTLLGMRTTLHGALAALAFVLVPVLAPTGDAAAQSWRGVPTFSTLDRGDGDSLIGVDLGLDWFKSDRFYEQAYRFDLHGQAVNRRGFGLYGQAPITVASGEEGATVLGDLELGGLWVTPQDPMFSFVLRLGVALPTASDDPGPPSDFLANRAGVIARLTDIALIVPDTTWLRLGVSPVFRGELVFLRADLGLDFPLHEGSGDPAPLIRANLGVGVDPGAWAFTAELASIANTGFLDPDNEFLHTAALAARYIGGSIQPSIALGLPLDSRLRDDVLFFAIAGLQLIL